MGTIKSAYSQGFSDGLNLYPRNPGDFKGADRQGYNMGYLDGGNKRRVSDVDRHTPLDQGATSAPKKTYDLLIHVADIHGHLSHRVQVEAINEIEALKLYPAALATVMTHYLDRIPTFITVQITPCGAHERLLRGEL